MADPKPLKALANVFENQWPDLMPCSSGPATKIAFLNARIAPDGLLSRFDFRGSMVCEQPFRTDFLALSDAGYNVMPALEKAGEALDACIILAGKFRALNENMINRAVEMTRPGGVVVVTGSKKTGIASLRKQAASRFGPVEHHTQYHSTVFWFTNVSDFGGQQMANGLPAMRRQIVTDEQTFYTAPGLFSSEKIDRGSALLSHHLSERIGGSVADLGAGWGYLGAAACRQSNSITKLVSYEADWNALNACRENLNNAAFSTAIDFHWHDVVNEPIAERFDWVIMNPPFHLEKALMVDLGTAFIKRSAQILKPGKHLMMVANQHLGYEKTLGEHFSSFKILDENQGFKIILARRSRG